MFPGILTNGTFGAFCSKCPEMHFGRVPCLPRETRPTLSVVLHVPRRQHGGAEKAFTVFMAPAYLIASFGKFLCRAGDAAIVLIFGTIATGLAEEDDRRHR